MSAYQERRAFSLALQGFLASRGWTGLTFKEGFQSDTAIVAPFVAITILPTRGEELQLGRTGEKLLKRVFQVDSYMEQESRAMGITDDIFLFMDETCVDIVDENSTVLGTLINPNTELLYSEVLPPRMTSPRVNHWRAINRGMFDAHYY